mgnify:CR=1 FL=1|tara:strand:- start:1428 stop:1970 length:543 start_codon:yes stop_codon:yes gene_type:complete
MFNKKILFVLFPIIMISCYNQSFENFNFDKLAINENATQLNTKFIEGLDPLVFDEFLGEWNFVSNEERFSSKKIINKEFIKKNSNVTYQINVEGNSKIKSLQFTIESELEINESELNFLIKAVSINIPQVDIQKIKTWTKQNILLVNEKFSKATILSNIYYRLQKPKKNKFTLTIRNYGA